ncbi:50S ribosomal protein L18 [Natronogracilivirga saccharolytica]|uniref:Large ribosomal subunit protein uL18 n=1 Tax=Natronogracilivirga saccharolytica TaxID=2812953 RepID=A0A8J7RLD6_9BACT|nr:50S ribosomal protein L18 [Natronogracilivirga saccharolytica]MBP3192273.1 50S ribosomal protein L18 [Natronogracilivirga saccharolytica]
MSNFSKTARRSKIRRRVRSKISGTADTPRLAVFKSSKHVYAQLIDDQAGHTIAAASTVSKNMKDQMGEKAKMEKAEAIGEFLAKEAIDKGINQVVFDRSGYKYHGIIKSLAEGARKGGLQF